MDKEYCPSYTLRFLYTRPNFTPEHHIKILAQENPEGLKSQKIRNGSYIMRLLNARIWLACRKLIPEKGDDIFSPTKQSFYDFCIPFEEERRLVNISTFGRVLKTNLPYDCTSTVRQRSGGKDPITGKNKQTIVSSIYKFYSLYDVMYSMEYQMALWIPWLADKKGDIGIFNQSSFDNWLELISNEPEELLMQDLLLAVKPEESEQIGDTFAPVLGKARTVAELKADKVPKSAMTQEEWNHMKLDFEKGFRGGVPTAKEKYAFSMRHEPGHDEWGYEL